MDMVLSSEFLVRSFDFVAVIRQVHFVDGSLSDARQLADFPQGLKPASILLARCGG
jgi:hypothetical protein